MSRSKNSSPSVVTIRERVDVLRTNQYVVNASRNHGSLGCILDLTRSELLKMNYSNHRSTLTIGADGVFLSPGWLSRNDVAS